MEQFETFLQHMTAQLPDSFYTEPTESRASDLQMRAAYLWSLLEMIREDLNALSRKSNNAVLGQMSIDAINRALGEVRRLVESDSSKLDLPVLNTRRPPTHADALMVLASYKHALRKFRVEVLREDPFRF